MIALSYTMVVLAAKRQHSQLSALHMSQNRCCIQPSLMTQDIAVDARQVFLISLTRISWVVTSGEALAAVDRIQGFIVLVKMGMLEFCFVM